MTNFPFVSRSIFPAITSLNHFTGIQVPFKLGTIKDITYSDSLYSDSNNSALTLK